MNKKLVFLQMLDEGTLQVSMLSVDIDGGGNEAH